MYDAFSWVIAGPFMYMAVLVFVVVTLNKVLVIARLPRHLRWDLYPIAHDGPSGSPYQKAEFWSSSRPYSFMHELAEMAQEIMLLKRTFLYNRRVWVFSFPMHFGFYLITGWLALLLLGVGAEIASGITISFASTLFWAKVINAITVVVGAAGLVFGLCGTAGLLWLRLTDEDLKDFTSPITFMNLFLLLALFAIGFAAFVFADPSFVLARRYINSLLSFSPLSGLPLIMLIEIMLFGAFLIYLPFSRMLHFAAKYFFYHNIMWDDEPVKAGSGLEQAIGGYLHYRLDWAAGHIASGGSWLDQATANPTQPKQEVRVADETKSPA